MANPYSGSRLFIGRQRELSRLVRSCREGESSLLIGGRRTGKTRLLDRLRQEELHRPYYLTDAGEWQLHTEADAIAKLGQTVGRTCASRDELLAAFRAVSPFCLAVDEADRLLGEPWSASLPAWLRWLIGSHGLHTEAAIILAGGPVLVGYEHPDEKGSPVLNISRKIYIRPFESADIHAMAAAGDQQAHLERLTQQAGGHPWLLESLLRELADGADADDACQLAFEQCHDAYQVWLRQLGEPGIAFLRCLPAGGVPARAFSRERAWIRHLPGMLRARQLCLIRETAVDEALHYLPGPDLFLSWFRAAPVSESWDLAISYASEDEELAREIKRGLGDQHKVFYAPDEQAWLWGENLSKVLPNVFGTKARFVLVLSTPHYVRKHWTRLEFQAARAAQRCLLVVNLGALPEQLPADVLYRDGSPASLVGLLDDLRKRLGSA